MRRFLALTCAVLLVSFSLCSCMDNTVDKVKDKASEVVSGSTNAPTDYSNDNNGLLDDNRETTSSTSPANDNAVGTENDMATEWDNMVEDGRIDDGDGNVGEAENNDGDGNIDTDAVD